MAVPDIADGTKMKNHLAHLAAGAARGITSTVLLLMSGMPVSAVMAKDLTPEKANTPSFRGVADSSLRPGDLVFFTQTSLTIQF